MVSHLFQQLLFLLARSTADDLQKQVEFLKAENEMLRKRVPKKHIFLTSDERAKLLKLGKELGPGIRQLITIVSYSTFRRWIRKEEGAMPRTGKGRPRIAQIIRELVLQIGNDTGWGYSRILGELRKLNLGKISRQSVKNILVEHGLDPGPKRGKGSWSEFLRIHADTLWQIDFFSKIVWTLKGPRQVFAMAFIHVGSRRVFATPATCKPDAGWMIAQAEAFLEFTAAMQLGCATVIRDLDGKYSAEFDRVFTDRSIKMKPVGPRAPNLNAFVERWIQSLKHEALNHFIVFGLEHFDHIVREFVGYYHDCRPHQGIGNRLISAGKEEPPAVDNVEQVRCEKRLGGLLKHYYCAA
ncbi:MAG: integrase core domain-containing protein [Pirellulales bacterium]